MTKTTKRFIIGISTVLLLIVIGLTAASFYFYGVAVKRSEKDFLNKSKDLKENFKEAADETKKELEGAEWVESKEYDTWTILSEDGLKLVGYYIPAQTPTTKTVILAHGYSSHGMDMGTFAKFYHEKLGYNVLMPDARGHGESEGDYIGFGWHERKDYLIWLQKVIDTVGQEAQIALHGISMGGATVMMVSGEELPEQVKVIIEDCGYTSVYNELSYQMKRMYHLPSFPILSTTSIVTDLLAGYNFYEASAVKQVQKNDLPMLFIHGGNDTFVPTEMVYDVYEACIAEKDLFLVEGAGHGLAYKTDTKGYEGKLTEFIERYIK